MTAPYAGRLSLFQVDPYMSSNAGALFCGMLFIVLVVATYWYYPKTGLGGFSQSIGVSTYFIQA